MLEKALIAIVLFFSYAFEIDSQIVTILSIL